MVGHDFVRVSPERAGVPSVNVQKFLQRLEDYNLNTHSVLMARGDMIFAECYYAPFTADFFHRMYSVSKSFVGVAIGLLIEDGRLSLDDRFYTFFPEYVGEEAHEWMKEMTIREALTMETCLPPCGNWFTSGTTDRTAYYFEKAPQHIPGTQFVYDSSVSYMLGVIVEKLTGQPFLEFLKDRVLRETGFSEEAYCIRCPGGRSFGDSGVMCTSRDLLRFARFVLNGGTWGGRRLMNEGYLRQATSRLVANNLYGDRAYDAYGYGYQIWQAPRGGFAFVGMGDQFAICDRETDFIFVITADNQGSSNSRCVIYQALYDLIVTQLGDPLPENAAAFAALTAFEQSRILNAADDCVESPFAEKLNGVTWRLDRNPMGIEWVRFDLAGDEGVLHYQNAQGEKALPFGFGHNVFGKFPETGYSDMVASQPAPGNRYDCAASAEWLEAQKLHIKVQIIDKYFGNCHMMFSFKGDRVAVLMQKTAEAFLNTYQGEAHGRAE